MKSVGILFILMLLIISCIEDDYTIPPEVVETTEEDNEIIFNDYFTFSLFSNNSTTNQSAAVYKDYLFLVPKYRGRIYLYNLEEKRLLCSYDMQAKTEKINGYDIYHCNQTTFGVDFYDCNDSFPLLYISQRAKNDKRCFTEVFRIITQKQNEESDYTSIEVQPVQTIYFPSMTKENSMGNVNCIIDRGNQLLYTYSRNNVKEDENYLQCKISCFSIPDFHQEVVYLEDSDIRSSFMINCSAYYMQGGCIAGQLMFIARGAASVKYIDVNIVDLKEQKLTKQFDLLGNGYRWEPEGCFFYNNHLMIATGKNIWEMSNLFSN